MKTTNEKIWKWRRCLGNMPRAPPVSLPVACHRPARMWPRRTPVPHGVCLLAGRPPGQERVGQASNRSEPLPPVPFPISPLRLSPSNCHCCRSLSSSPCRPPRCSSARARPPEAAPEGELATRPITVASSGQVYVDLAFSPNVLTIDLIVDLVAPVSLGVSPLHRRVRNSFANHIDLFSPLFPPRGRWILGFPQPLCTDHLHLPIDDHLRGCSSTTEAMPMKPKHP